MYRYRNRRMLTLWCENHISIALLVCYVRYIICFLILYQEPGRISEIPDIAQFKIARLYSTATTNLGQNFGYTMLIFLLLFITVTSQITGVSIVCSTVCSGGDQRKHQSSSSLAFMRGIHYWAPCRFAGFLRRHAAHSNEQDASHCLSVRYLPIYPL